MTRELMTVGEAREYLQVSKVKMAELVRPGTGVLVTQRDPLDKRIRLVKRADVEKLAAQSSKSAA